MDVVKDGQDIDSAAFLAEHSAFRGLCPVCGRSALFHGFTDNVRDSGPCARCGATNRQRQIGWVIRRQLGLAMHGPMRFARRWTWRPHPFRVYNTESQGPLHRSLRRLGQYVASEYLGPQYRSGSQVGRYRHEDLQQLSFANDSFNLVVSGDVLEHLPHPYQAHAEIFRVLRPGGRHIFTVPFGMEMQADDVRAELAGDQIVYHGEPLYHYDPIHPDTGVLVWTIFGRSMLDRLRALGFETEVREVARLECGILGPGALVFEARKPALVRT